MGIQNWESEFLRGEQKVLIRMLGPEAGGEPVVFDVGAHVGDYSALVLKVAPTARVHAFEPNPGSYVRLAARFPNKNVTAVQAAVGASAGKVNLYDYRNEDASSHASLLMDVFERVHTAEASARQVEMITLSEYVEKLELEEIALLKVDVEGSELDVLEGLKTVLERGQPKIRFIQLEFNEMNVISRTFLEDLCQHLRGFSVHRVLPGGRTIDVTQERLLLRELFGYQNLIFSRSQLD